LKKELQKVSSEKQALNNLFNDLLVEIDELKEKKESLGNVVVLDLEVLKKTQDLVAKQEEEDKLEMKKKGLMEGEIKEEKEKIYKLDKEFTSLESNAKKLENQVKGYQIESERLNNQIQILQKQHTKYGAEASTAHARFYQTVEELKIKNNIIDELKKKNVDLENKLKHQQNLYEAVRSDRNLYSKNLLEATEEINNLVKKFTMMRHQIKHLTEEIKSKSNQVLTRHVDHEGVSELRCS